MSVDREEFFGTHNEISLRQALQPEMTAFLESQMDAIEKGGIGFLPRRATSRLWWYGFTPTPDRKRELLTLLNWWIGPTFSDLPARHGSLDPTDAFDTALDEGKVLRFEVLPQRTANQENAARARDSVRASLWRLGRLVNGRPPSEFDAPRSTVEVLDDLGHAISAQDRSIALACLRELEATADLDQSNMAFLRLRAFAGFQDWKSLLADRDLEHVLAMRRPAKVSLAIQQAVYASRLATHDQAGREQDLLDALAELPSTFRALRTDSTSTTRAQAVTEFLIALESESEDSIARIVDDSGSIDAKLPGHLRNILHTYRNIPLGESPDTTENTAPDPTEGPTRTPLEQATEMMLRSNFEAAIEAALKLEPGLHSAHILLSCARELESQQHASTVAHYISAHDLREVIGGAYAQLRDSLSWLEEFLQGEPGLDWHSWLEALGGDHRTAALEADAGTTDSWPPLSRAVLAAWLLSAPAEALGSLGEVGGQFMAVHREIFTADGAAELNERVLAGLALSGKNSAGVRVQTQALLDYLLSAHPTAKIFTDALMWTGDIVSANASAMTTSWVVDILQTATATPAAVASPATEKFFHQVIGHLRPFKTALSPTDIEALKIVSEELCQTVPGDLLAVQDKDADLGAPFRYLADSKVVLYSLTESATTRAAQMLRVLVPGIDIETSAEHDGSGKLAAQAANADVFVVVTASAKHAATDFITAKRGKRPIVLVNSRGSSAILRELAKG
ncbi:protein DpdD [Kitasatospora sp. NPDC008115]|uniref:protein DpdD n=1 Tax=Kitasatospora sp. NPDC008115 TaxID=3364022 RepID=UPI0036E24A8C